MRRGDGQNMNQPKPAIADQGFEIIARQDFSDVTYLLEFRHPLMAKAAQPGQFVIVMSGDHGERIPLTIADFDRSRGTITLVIQAVGKTTRQMQQECKVGDKVLFACVDGPDFDGHQVDFDDLMGRLKRYSTTEKAALDRWNESCRIRGQADEAVTKVPAAGA